MELQVVGVYSVAAAEPTHLVELAVAQCSEQLDWSLITQEQLGELRENWQVPWDERFLDHTGTLPLEPPDTPAALSAFRVAFFFHYLDFDKPLITPAGPLMLPEPRARPARLAFIDYEPPC